MIVEKVQLITMTIIFLSYKIQNTCLYSKCNKVSEFYLEQ